MLSDMAFGHNEPVSSAAFELNWTKHHYAARITNNQFQAVASHLGTESDLLAGFQHNTRLRTVNRGKLVNDDQVRASFLNAWNTEKVLRLNPEYMSDGLDCALQWAFPQAYYSAFSASVGYFSTVGHSQRSHSAVQWQVGDLVAKGAYPHQLSFYASGGSSTIIEGLTSNPTELTNPCRFDETSASDIESHVASFLRSTRKKELREKLKSSGMRTKAGKKRKSFSKKQKDEIGKKLGNTTLLNLLYRKRIKANYREIDTYLADSIDASVLFKNLIHITSQWNVAHQLLSTKALGPKKFSEFLNKAPDFVLERHEICARVVRSLS